MNVFDLLLRVVNVFNLFITYGDTFLPTPSSYDELYYELNRVANVFDNLYLMARRYSALDCEFKQDAMRLTNGLINIRAITNHFAPKIQAWLESKGLSTPTEEQVLEVVRGNYDSLTLKLQDSLDQYERYTEKPTHTSFFTTLVRGIVNDTRSNLDFGGMDLQAILQEFSSIS
uniref:Putative conserved secreted protein n=1 Tax=Xenopsylla cheopis TaxID=163159 RepID=A0A6M2DYT5_XENCH